MTRREHSTRVEARTFATPNGATHTLHRAICACGWMGGDNQSPDGARFAGKYHRLTVAERARDARPRPEPVATPEPIKPVVPVVDEPDEPDTDEPAPSADEPQDEPDEANTDEPIEPAPEWDHWLSLTNDERAAHMARGNLANIGDMRTRASTLETVVHQAYRDAQTPPTPEMAFAPQQGALAL